MCASVAYDSRIIDLGFPPHFVCRASQDWKTYRKVGSGRNTLIVNEVLPSFSLRSLRDSFLESRISAVVVQSIDSSSGPRIYIPGQ